MVSLACALGWRRLVRWFPAAGLIEEHEAFESMVGTAGGRGRSLEPCWQSWWRYAGLGVLFAVAGGWSKAARDEHLLIRPLQIRLNVRVPRDMCERVFS